MWIFISIIILSIFLLLYIFRRNFSQTSVEKVAKCPEIHPLIILIFYIPIFLVKGLVPAILMARKSYGSTFCLYVWGIKRRIFFITGLNGRNAISKNPHIRLPAAQVAQVFGLSKDNIEIAMNSEYIHELGGVFQGVELKNMTSRHFNNLQKTIRECLDCGEKWTETGLYDLCSILVYESITTTLYGSDVDARLIVEELKSLDTDVHLLAYPSPYRWFKPNLIRSRNKIAKRLSLINVNDSDNIFLNKIDELASILSKEDMGYVNTAILWASYGNVIPAIFWTYFYLQRYPKVRDIILQEIESVSSETATDDLIYSMPQLDSVIEETMRLLSNALVVRECTQDTKVTIAGADYEIFLQENDILVLFPFASQIDEAYFPHPYTFIYDRFIIGSSNEVSTAARRAHAPFGEGKFICPGRYLGKNIIKLTIITLLKEFDIEFFDHYESMKTPAMLKTRHGFGIPPPEKDVRVRYRVK